MEPIQYSLELLKEKFPLTSLFCKSFLCEFNVWKCDGRKPGRVNLYEFKIFSEKYRFMNVFFLERSRYNKYYYGIIIITLHRAVYSNWNCK